MENQNVNEEILSEPKERLINSAKLGRILNKIIKVFEEEQLNTGEILLVSDNLVYMASEAFNSEIEERLPQIQKPSQNYIG